MKYLVLLLGFSSLTACTSTLDKLDQVGKPPALEVVRNPQAEPGYKPMTWPLPDPEPETQRHANSLWQPGARTFFRDLRATRVGDIMRVNIEINDKAQLDSTSDRSRTASEDVDAPGLFGVGGHLLSLVPGDQNSRENLINLNTTMDNTGAGAINRKEKVETQVAAIVTQRLPNGNLVIEGKQEVRVNFELREVSVSGVIRPEDIDEDNTIDASQIAEARITYGGRGQLSDVQQPRWGHQVIDILSPF